ncbi:MAG: AbrB/MazE/SpoVT family DNA-binding domain-containing protein [Nanoarchaeota archaeon]|nr:AbrB/MazE/SpoVT family DNA-binding domain-containing protein [Nanoarchaeota archaeon]
MVRCYKCGRKMKYIRGLKFNQYAVDGWKCGDCGEVYYDADQAQRILLLNKLKKQKFRLKLNQVRSNLILRIPKEVGEAMGLRNGSEIEFSLKDDDKIIIST